MNSIRSQTVTSCTPHETRQSVLLKIESPQNDPFLRETLNLATLSSFLDIFRIISKALRSSSKMIPILA